MLLYSSGYWGVGFSFTLKGSVILKGVAWGVPATSTAVLVQHYSQDEWADFDFQGLMNALDSYTFLLMFLLAFRTQLAYGRLWDGMACVQSMRGSWINAVSACLSFTNENAAVRPQVEQFRHMLCRLVSMMYCGALQSVAEMDDNSMDIIDLDGFDKESVKWLARQPEKCELLIQWLRRIIVRAVANGTIAAPPPIVSRAFQELDRGMVSLQEARRIKFVPFPFPYAQILTWMLIIYTLCAAGAAGAYHAMTTSVICTFVRVTAMWCVNYISMELEMPYGDDSNDLPLKDLQKDMNHSLIMLMQPGALHPADFKYCKSRHNLEIDSLAESAEAELEVESKCTLWKAECVPFLAERRKATRTTGIRQTLLGKNVWRSTTTGKQALMSDEPSQSDLNRMSVLTAVDNHMIGHRLSNYQDDETDAGEVDSQEQKQPPVEATPVSGAVVFGGKPEAQTRMSFPLSEETSDDLSYEKRTTTGSKLDVLEGSPLVRIANDIVQELRCIHEEFSSLRSLTTPGTATSLPPPPAFASTSKAARSLTPNVDYPATYAKSFSLSCGAFPTVLKSPGCLTTKPCPSQTVGKVTRLATVTDAS
eukprot:TRINITY_DN2276_c1_g1_i1.p1 TRINITY_DN2276_c1_g1~~TRINITY_DN2276_c1_g1_i1.p1  ORF type:complete len:591 (-),score=78.42 TRINITY_DN2276_c1_g1_i1:80-1852(-)